MKVKDMIEKLLQCDPDSHIEVSVNQYGKRYPVAYCEVDTVINKQNGQDTRIIIALPDTMRTRSMKQIS
jgi:hypothetical protein